MSPQSQMDRVELNILSALAAEGAFARLDEGRARIFAPRKGITVQTGSFDAAVLQRLVESGAVVARKGARTVSYYLDEAGAKLLARSQLTPDDAFARQHSEFEEVAEDAAHGVDAHAVNLRESPLTWLRRRGGHVVGDAEFAAGERLRSDMTLARTLPSLSPDWQRPSRSGVAIGLLPSEARMAAAQRVQNALHAVGPELSGVLVDVCGFLKGLESVERERRWPVRSAKVVLSMALASLARHYGLSNTAVGVARGGPRSWAAEGAHQPFVMPQPDAAAPPP